MPTLTTSNVRHSRDGAADLGGCHVSVFGLWSKPDLLDKALVMIHTELNHHVHKLIEQALDVRTRELLSATALLDQQHELLEGELSARRMHARDRAGMS